MQILDPDSHSFLQNSKRIIIEKSQRTQTIIDGHINCFGVVYIVSCVHPDAIAVILCETATVNVKYDWVMGGSVVI